MTQNFSISTRTVGRTAVSAAGLPSLVQRFLTQRLIEQQGLSSHMVASYLDTFRLPLGFATKNIGREPSKLRIEDFDVSLIEEFLQHLEHGRSNSVRTRNTRLAAVHAFVLFVAVREPALFLQCQRILAIPSKRSEHGPVEFLTESEAAALVRASDVQAWIGSRDRTLLLVAVQTGLRNSELTTLRRQDVMLGPGAHVRCLGKGRRWDALRCDRISLPS
jgi:integrase/recombinase XerD